MGESVSINPASGHIVASHKQITESVANSKLLKAYGECVRWRDTTYSHRAVLFRRLAELLEQNETRFALMAVNEMGKLVSQARSEVKKCVQVCRYYAEHAYHFLRDQPVESEASRSYITFMPLGVVLGVARWDYPFYQVIRFAAPALMAGNAALLKHSSCVQGCALAIEQAFQEAGFPASLFVNVNVNDRTLENMVAHPRVAAVVVSGNIMSGRALVSAAGWHLKKVVRSMGDSHPYIIEKDADIDLAVDIAMFNTMQNCGQDCMVSKRFIVHEQIYDLFIDAMRVKFETARMGDPLDDVTRYGPVARRDLRDKVHWQVLESLRQGARLVCGGVLPAGHGAYYPATILADVTPGMEVFDHELYGPVAAVIRAQNMTHAVSLANHRGFGLGSGVITGDWREGVVVARRINAVSLFINSKVVTDPFTPMVEAKYNGYRQELSSLGIYEFVEMKMISVC